MMDKDEGSLTRRDARKNRLVVISNRVADLRKSAQSGGLAVGLADAMKARGGLWFGWDGTIAEEAGPPKSETVGNVQLLSTPLTQEEYDAYYVGYSNSVLWPLCHYRLDLVDYQTGHFEGYCAVNQRFAKAVAPALKPDDLVWVQDYHLIPLASELRKLGCRQRVGFFLHIPFPPPDMLAASPNHAALVDALLQYDVIGFQTHVDVGNLKHYLAEFSGAELLHDGLVKVGERTVRIERFPIGIDVDSFAEMARYAPEDVRLDTMRRQILGRKQIIGVDRLDYSKGLPERLSAFERLLEHHPEWERSVTLLQIAPPTREDVEAYAEIRAQLESLSGAINGRYADFNWTPIRYIHRSIPRDKLAALFRVSHVGFVTPLRDGMNLVAKEYVAAQDPEDPGVLVLSQFAGAAEEMPDALIVNPYDLDDMANSLHEALSMPLEERRRRHASLLQSVRTYDAGNWLMRFLERLEAVEAPAHATAPASLGNRSGGTLGASLL
jgi:trehalose 6-phosphate synthase